MTSFDAGTTLESAGEFFRYVSPRVFPPAAGHTGSASAQRFRQQKTRALFFSQHVACNVCVSKFHTPRLLRLRGIKDGFGIESSGKLLQVSPWKGRQAQRLRGHAALPLLQGERAGGCRPDQVHTTSSVQHSTVCGWNEGDAEAKTTCLTLLLQYQSLERASVARRPFDRVGTQAVGEAPQSSSTVVLRRMLPPVGG